MITRLTFLLALTLTQNGCDLFTSVSDYCPSITDTSHQYYGFADADNLVIFIHGLCGDAKTTWTNPATHFVFPESLARDLAKENQRSYVIAFDYVSRLQGGPSILSIADRLEFEIGELLKKHPYRTLRIVAHSMGGLVAREYVLRRHHRAHPLLKLTNLVLLATPNNGSELAELRWVTPEHRQVEELRHIDKGNTYIESLNNDWNREFKAAGHPRHVLLYAGYEELSRSFMGKVVQLSSAIVYADASMGFQEDHLGIAKPKDTSDATYRWVKAKLGESIENTARQLLAGMVQQGLLQPADVPQQLPRTVELLEQLQTFAGTEYEKALGYVKDGKFEAALSLLSERESTETRLIEDIARRRFMQGAIYELQFETSQAASYYSQATQLAPSNALYRERFGRVLIHTGDSRSATVQFEHAIRLSQAGGNLHLKANALAGLGTAYTSLGQYIEAVNCLEQAVVIHSNLADIANEGADLVELGIVYENQGQYVKAAQYFEQALVINRNIGNMPVMITALANLGIVHKDQGHYVKAIEYFEEGLAIYREHGDIRNEAITLGNLGTTYGSLGQYKKASELSEQALTIFRKIGDVRGESNALGNLGEAYVSLGEDAKGIECLKLSLDIARRIGDLREESNALGKLGSVYDKLGQYAMSIQYFEKSITISQKIGDLRTESTSHGNLGGVYGKQRLYHKAIEHFELALAMSQKTGDARGEASSLANLGIVYKNQGQNVRALEFMEKSRRIFIVRLGIKFPLETQMDKLKAEPRRD
jgi:tetratricopeptide (TPR) repeat protein/pimeloyl-ACP methyl ester carboxylesterase